MTLDDDVWKGPLTADKHILDTKKNGSRRKEEERRRNMKRIILNILITSKPLFNGGVWCCFSSPLFCHFFSKSTCSAFLLSQVYIDRYIHYKERCNRSERTTNTKMMNSKTSFSLDMFKIALTYSKRCETS